MKETDVRIFVDGGCSVREEDESGKELGIDIVPLDIKFYENGNWVTYSDSDLSSEQFYQKMRSGKKLPQTSGAVSGRLTERFSRLETNRQAISLHITSRHSVSWESGVLAREITLQERPDLVIEVVDSKSVSLGTWFLAEQAAILAAEGASIEEIKQQILSNIPKVDVYAMVASMDNLVKGGRVSNLSGFIGSVLQINPIMGVEDGKIIPYAKPRTVNKAKRELVARVEGIDADLSRLSVIHTNGIENALEVREMLSKFYDKDIPIQEAGPVFGVHLGEGGVGIALLKK